MNPEPYCFAFNGADNQYNFITYENYFFIFTPGGEYFVEGGIIEGAYGNNFDVPYFFFNEQAPNIAVDVHIAGPAQFDVPYKDSMSFNGPDIGSYTIKLGKYTNTLGGQTSTYPSEMISGIESTDNRAAASGASYDLSWTNPAQSLHNGWYYDNGVTSHYPFWDGTPGFEAHSWEHKYDSANLATTTVC